MNRLDDLRVRQLDDALRTFDKARPRTPPANGWVKTVREALGMSIRQLAQRTNLSRTSVASAEKSEARGSVQLDTLQRLADGLECDLAYSLVPRTSLDDLLRKQARMKAERLVGRVSDSMDLEAQAISADQQERQVDDLADEILRNRGRDFWDV